MISLPQPKRSYCDLLIKSVWEANENSTPTTSYLRLTLDLTTLQMPSLVSEPSILEFYLYCGSFFFFCKRNAARAALRSSSPLPPTPPSGLLSLPISQRVERGNVLWFPRSWGAAATPERPATPASSPNSQVWAVYKMFLTRCGWQGRFCSYITLIELTG